MEHHKVLKISSHHHDLCRSGGWFFHPIMGRWVWPASIHQVECHLTNHFWSSLLLVDLNDRLYILQIRIWHWHWHCSPDFGDLHFGNYSFYSEGKFGCKIKNMVVCRMFVHLRIRVVLTKNASLEASSVCNLFARNICAHRDLQDRTLKSSVFVGQRQNLVSLWAHIPYVLTEWSTDDPERVNLVFGKH